jgi:hypothetical protein
MSSSTTSKLPRSRKEVKRIVAEEISRLGNISRRVYTRTYRISCRPQRRGLGAWTELQNLQLQHFFSPHFFFFLCFATYEESRSTSWLDLICDPRCIWCVAGRPRKQESCRKEGIEEHGVAGSSTPCSLRSFYIFFKYIYICSFQKGKEVAYSRCCFCFPTKLPRSTFFHPHDQFYVLKFSTKGIYKENLLSRF